MSDDKALTARDVIEEALAATAREGKRMFTERTARILAALDAAGFEITAKDEVEHLRRLAVEHIQTDNHPLMEAAAREERDRTVRWLRRNATHEEDVLANLIERGEAHD